MKSKRNFFASLFLLSQIIIWAWMHYLNLGLAIKLDNLEKKNLASLNQQKELRLKAAKLASLQRVKKESEKMDLAKITSFINLGVSQKIALKP